MAEAMAERDEESGQYKETYPLDEFIDALRDLDGAAGTQEVADAVGCKYRTAHAKLTELREEGRVEAREVGAAFLWMLADGGDRGE